MNILSLFIIASVFLSQTNIIAMQYFKKILGTCKKNRHVTSINDPESTDSENPHDGPCEIENNIKFLDKIKGCYEKGEANCYNCYEQCAERCCHDPLESLYPNITDCMTMSLVLFIVCACFCISLQHITST